MCMPESYHFGFVEDPFHFIESDKFFMSLNSNMRQLTFFILFWYRFNKSPFPQPFWRKRYLAW